MGWAREVGTHSWRDNHQSRIQYEKYYHWNWLLGTLESDEQCGAVMPPAQL